MESDQATLTPREEAYLEHVRQAREQGVTLKEHCERHGLNVRSLYGVRRDLVKKGVVPRELLSNLVYRMNESGGFLLLSLIDTVDKLDSGDDIGELLEPRRRRHRFCALIAS